MPVIEEARLEGKDFKADVLVLKETEREWKVWRAFNAVLSKKNDLALRVYAAMLEGEGRVSTRDLATRLDTPLYSVRMALNSLKELGLVSQERTARGELYPYMLSYWVVDKVVLGFFRPIPPEYFREGYPPRLVDG